MVNVKLPSWPTASSLAAPDSIADLLVGDVAIVNFHSLVAPQKGVEAMSRDYVVR